MAFILKNFTSIGGETKGGQSVREFSYRVPEGEDIGDVVVDNYFLPVINTLMERDIIRLLFDDGRYLTILVSDIASNHIEVVENRIVSYATEESAGVITIASGAEVEAGVDGAKAVTPATLKQETDKCVKLSSGVAQAIDSDIIIKDGRGLSVVDGNGEVFDSVVAREGVLNIGEVPLPLCLNHSGGNIPVNYLDGDGNPVADAVAYTSDVEAEATRAKAVEGKLNNLATDAKENLVGAVNEVNAIARGRLNAIVFESDEDLDNWFAGTFTREDGLLPSGLVMGQNIYVKNLNEPDWWVSHVPVTSVEDLSVLPMDKLDLSTYRTAALQDVIDGSKANVNLDNIDDDGEAKLKSICSDLDLSNITEEGEQKIINLSGGFGALPAYDSSKVINVGNGWTATGDGYIFVRTGAGAMINQIEIAINGVTVWSSWVANEGAGDRGSAFMPVSKGDVVNAWGQHVNSIFFLPLKVSSDITDKLNELATKVDEYVDYVRATSITGGYLGQFTSNAMAYSGSNRPAGHLVCDGSTISNITIVEGQTSPYGGLIGFFVANVDSYISFADYQAMYDLGDDVPYFAFEALEDGGYNIRVPFVRDRMKGAVQIYKLVQIGNVEVGNGEAV